MSMISLHKASLNLGTRPLLDKVDCSIEYNEKIALVGRNGAGKSTLLKVLTGSIVLDSGEINRVNGLKIASLAQEVPSGAKGFVYHFLFQALGETGELAGQYYELSRKNDHSEAMALCQQRMEEACAWDILPRVEMMANRLGIDLSLSMTKLSGGMKRRVLLAAALIQDADMLLLDEPTNHLDIASIEWLESYLKQSTATVILITHDRAFLSQIANKIIEIDRGQLYLFECNYEQYQDRREVRHLTEQKHHQLFDKKLAEEEVWLRQGVKARRTRNEGRVRALKAMRDEYQQRREAMGTMKSFSLETKQSGKLVLEAQHLSYAIAGKTIISDFSLLMSRGDKVGIIGPNGCGKTTLIQLLTGTLSASEGKIRTGTNIDIAYFDQLRQQLDDQSSLMNNVADSADFVNFNGRQVHVASYLKQFLFRPEQFNQPVSVLSGGERNRLLLAKLFAKPVNLLIMDEPSNDLDMETLELLESILMDFQGSLLLISHDRTLINNIVSSLLVYEEHGQFVEYVGGFEDYVRQRKQQKQKAVTAPQPAAKTKKKAVKLSYNEQRELSEMPRKIELLEEKIAKLQEAMSGTDFYQQDANTIAESQQTLKQCEQSLLDLYDRWEVLEDKSKL